MAGSDAQDPDRAAILARRRQFIAVALGSIAVGCPATNPTPSPEPTGDSASESEAATTGDESDSGTGTPRPCLKFDLPPEPGTDSETDGGGETTGPPPCLAGFRP